MSTPLVNTGQPTFIIIVINRRSAITSHTSHGHQTGTRSMQPVRSVPLGGPVVSQVYASATSHCIHLTVEAEASPI